MNTPNRNAVVQMTLDWVDVMEAVTEGVDELGDLYFNGGHEHYHDHWFWGDMNRFRKEVWDKHVSAQVDFMQLWHDELDTDIYTSDWLFGIRNEHCIPYELPIIAAFMMQEVNAFGQRLMGVQEKESSLINVQALVRGKQSRYGKTMGEYQEIADYDSVSLFPSKVYHD